MSDRTRIAKLEKDVERLETALVVVAQAIPDHPWRYRTPRSGPLAVIWKRVRKRSMGEGQG
jgi:hypothetical protein